jgi:hypothetical protein
MNKEPASHRSPRSTASRTKGKPRQVLEKVKDAARTAWNRVEDAIPGDSDKDGH